MEYKFLDTTPSFSTISSARRIGLNLLVATGYTASGYAGLKLAFVAHAVTLFWPPSGLALAAVWLGGLRLLPGVFLGAFTVNFLTNGKPELAVAIALGNMLPSLIGSLVLRAMIARQPKAGELKRLLMFIFVAVLGCTMASATVGTLSVSTIGHVTTPVTTTWLIWWMGDAMGVMIVAPPILLWRRVLTGGIRWQRVGEIVAFGLAGMGVLAAMLLIDKPVWVVELCKLCTLLLSLQAGARFGLPGPAWITLLMAFGTVGITVMGEGPFLRGDFYDSFAFVHAYLFAEAVTGMLLAAALADLRSTVQREKLARADAEAAAVNHIRLLAMISHDVRTPLSGIMGVFQTLARSAPAPDQEGLIGLGLRAGVTLTTLVADILDVARAESGRIVLDIAPFSPGQSVTDIVDMHRDAAAAKHLHLDLTCAANLPYLVLGDRIRFEQIIGNLVSNAVLYTAHGGVSVAAAWDGVVERKLIVSIIDSGPGMDPLFVSGNFDALAAPPESRNLSAGLGLGLHICQHLVSLMHGALEYSEAPGGGSCFSVALPLSASHPAQAEPMPAAVGEPALRVLLVEDDEIAGETTCALLKTYGHHVTLAADADTASRLVGSDSFDFILLDMQLSPEGSSGLDVVRHVRALPGSASATRIFALTGDGLDEHHANYRAAGLDGLILKPLMITADLATVLHAAAWPAAGRMTGSRSLFPVSS